MSREIPTYADLFPELITEAVLTPATVWGSGMRVGSVRPTTTTQVFQIALEEQKLANRSQFSTDARDQKRIVNDIMKETETHIDLSLSRDNTLCVVVTGKTKNVATARLQLLKRLQKEASKRVSIPKEHYGNIIGRNGETLKRIQDETGTRIKVPNADSETDEVIITGTMEGCTKAMEMILYISDVESKRDRVTLDILKAYHPLIAGYKNETIKRIKAETNVNIHVPPSNRDVDEIVVSGEKVGVHKAVAELNAIYEMKRSSCGELTAQVNKSQHKYIIGPRGSHLDQVMELYGVYVDVPPADSDSETITLRGDQLQLVHALTMMYEKASSMTSDTTKVPGWLHKVIIGKKGSNLSKLQEEFPNVSVNFHRDTDEVEFEGPSDLVAGFKTKIENVAKVLIATTAFDEAVVHPDFHSRIIGKQGAIVGKIKDSTGCQISFPRDDTAPDKMDVIRIEGPKEGVAAAKAQILGIAEKLKHSRKIDMIIPQKYHSAIIGKEGKAIKIMIAEYGPDITIDVPNSKQTSDIIKIAGHKDNVEKMEKHLKKFIKEQELSNYSEDVAIFKQYHRSVIGKEGVVIKKIKDECGARIDVPSADAETELITLTGTKEQVAKARAAILKIQADIATIVTEEIIIDQKVQLIIRGKVAKSISTGSGGVSIAFNDKTDKVTVRGPEDNVAKAKTALLDLATQQAVGGAIEELDIAKKHHKQLIGRNGVAVNKVQEDTGVRIIFPSSSAKDDEKVMIIGKKEGVATAKKTLLEKAKLLDSIIKDTIDIDHKYHRMFIARRAQFLMDIKADTAVDIQLPKDKSNTIALEGPDVNMPAAKKALEDFVKDIEARVTVTIQIPSRDHGSVLGKSGANIRRITTDCNVKVDFPEKKSNSKAGEDGVNPADTITIAGLAENCEKASQQLLELVPIEEVIEIEPDYHRFIIGTKGEGIRKLMQSHDVNVKFPQNSKSDPKVVMRGTKENIAALRVDFEARVVELDEEKEERAKKSFQVELTIDSRFHLKLIGKGGANINEFRDKYDVQVDFPDRRKKLSKVQAKIVTIKGYEDKATAAAEEMMAEVKKFESMVTITIELDPGCHRKIIGKGGDNIKSLQKKHGVRIMMPRDDGTAIKIEGDEDPAIVCKDALLDIEEEWLQEEEEYAEKREARPKPQKKEEKKAAAKPQKKQPAPAFNMQGAPWESTFPGLGGVVSKPSSGPTPWGKK